MARARNGTVARALRYFRRATSSRPTPRYAKAARHESTPAGTGKPGAGRKARAQARQGAGPRVPHTGQHVGSSTAAGYGGGTTGSGVDSGGTRRRASRCYRWSMRTTVRLDDDVAAAVERLRREQGIGLSEAINHLARAGLVSAGPRHRVRLRSAPLDLRVDVSNVAEAVAVGEGPSHR